MQSVRQALIEQDRLLLQPNTAFARRGDQFGVRLRLVPFAGGRVERRDVVVLLETARAEFA